MQGGTLWVGSAVEAVSRSTLERGRESFDISKVKHNDAARTNEQNEWWNTDCEKSSSREDGKPRTSWQGQKCQCRVARKASRALPKSNKQYNLSLRFARLLWNVCWVLLPQTARRWLARATQELSLIPRGKLHANLCEIALFHLEVINACGKLGSWLVSKLFCRHSVRCTVMTFFLVFETACTPKTCAKKQWKTFRNLTLYGPYILESVVHDGFAFIKKGGFPYVKYGSNWHVKG